MRIILEFAPLQENLRLPIQYNNLIQGFIYNHLDDVVATHLHNEGKAFGKRQFRFFTFSRIQGKYKIEKENIIFEGNIKLQISSVHDDVLESLVKCLLNKVLIKLGNNECELIKIEVEEPPKYKRLLKVKALSPITVYSTLADGKGHKKTYYYSPWENEWESQLLANLWRKSKALGWEQKELDLLEGAHIKPLHVKKRDLQILKYRETVIKGWTGSYELYLPEPYFYLAYDAGLGSKNSQGFGMAKVI